MLKRGTKFRIAPYGVCVVSSYDDTSGKYIMRVWNSSETFYASQEEIDTYIRAREEYIATEVLWKCGWAEFVKRCELVGIEDYIDEHTPCEGPDAQCNMFCFRYGKDC